MSTTGVSNGGNHDGANGAAIPHGMDPAEYAKLQAAGQRLATAEEVAAPTGNPVKRFVLWVLSFVIPGLGMFSEAYYVFAVGNLKPIWKVEYPACWATHTECSSQLSNSISYTQVGGIICGQLFLGFIADRIGRKLGSILTATTMLIGAILITASDGSTVNDQFIMFTIVQFIFGVGVGGEYPVASTSANERAESSSRLQNRRGQTVVLTFSMQGWGNVINTIVIIIIMAAANQYGQPYNNTSLEIVWRLSYALGIIPLLFIFVWRIWVLRESAVWKGKREALSTINTRRFDPRKVGLLLYYYWHRIAGTALSWFVWDFAFYGNKLFQGVFIKIINPGASLIQVLEWTLLNSTVALVGYYFAAFTVDRAWMGRKRMQAMGFTFMFVLFLICAADYDGLTAPGGIHAFQFLYYFSSFWGQFGPNATTWLLPAELAPTEVRSMCHGFSAAVGKAGALVAGVIFSLVNNRGKFWISAFCGLGGAILTLVLIADTTGLDLREGDKRWLAILDGMHDTYGGEAVNPKHLSLFEKWFLGYGKLYQGPGYVHKPVEGKQHTTAVEVDGLVVGTKTEEGPGADVHRNLERLSQQFKEEERNSQYPLRFQG